MTEWYVRHVGEEDAIWICCLLSDTVADSKFPGGWKYKEHGLVPSVSSVLLIPLRGREETLGVLRLTSHKPEAFDIALQEIFVAMTEVTGVNLQALQLKFQTERQKEVLARDRATYLELSLAYRQILNSMLPSHVVDRLSKMKSPVGSKTGSNNTSEQLDTPSTASSAHIQVLSTDLSQSNDNLKRQRRAYGGPPMPSHITQQLDKLAYAEYHNCVAILFSDVKGFTVLSSSASPEEVMIMLDDLFGRFDAIIEAHSPVAYKVETVGDAYMVAFGLFGITGCTEDETVTATAVALRAVTVGAEMVKAAEMVQTPMKGAVEIRVGVHIGRIMSGIIGNKAPRYCMFGDTVNTASRMESTGVPGLIHVTEDIKLACEGEKGGKALKFNSTGGKEVKGKGWMLTYLLEPNEVISISVKEGHEIALQQQLRLLNGPRSPTSRNSAPEMPQRTALEQPANAGFLMKLASLTYSICRCR